jgi:tetratricopeptide (TPR) repeat protein
MTGHATWQQIRDIEAREAAVVPESSPVDAVLELALLLLEPAHRDDEAIELLEKVLARDPTYSPARLWLAYALLHTRMDTVALERAREVLTPLIDTPETAGAARLLLAEVGEEQGMTVDERISLLEASVAAEPEWISNRQDLAWAYSEAGRHQEAATQLEAALHSVIAANPSWGIARQAFEESITARTADGTIARLQADLSKLRLGS